MNSYQSKNKNPLLSCALTGGFEDLSGGIVLATAEKPVFTIGNAPVISDTDNFSEVSLDRDGNSSEIGGASDLQADGTNSFYTSPLAELDSYNNLQLLHDLNQQLPPPPPTLDVSSDGDQQQQQQSLDANFNPISAAFGSAASTVFSTFTNIIKGSTSQSRIEDQQQQQQVPMTMNTNEPPMTYQDPNMNLYGFNNLQPDVNALPPPSFFSPNDETLFNKQPTVETPLSNTFRLGGSKKKTYAHIPGLSSSATNSQPIPQNFNLMPSMPPLPPQPITQVDSMANFPPPAAVAFQAAATPQSVHEHVEQKSQQSSNKFSFSSLLDKIPVTKTLFGGSSEQNPNEFYQNNGGDRSSDFSQAFQTPPQAEPVNYYMPQAQPNERQITGGARTHENSVNINFFGSQPSLTVNTPPPVINNDLVSFQKADAVAPIPGENNNNFATVNFFNPQQFNTKPFAKVQQPHVAAAAVTADDDVTQGNESTGKNESVLSQAQGSSSFMTPPLPSLPPAPLFNVPPQQNEIQQQQHPSIQFMPQNYSTPPAVAPFVENNSFQQTNDPCAPPPIFFNPNETPDMFKPRRPSIDAKSKNPYSNNRARGIGLYRARTTSSSESTANQQIMMLPAAAAAPMSSVQQSQPFFTPACHDTIDQAQSSLSRPPSIPPIEQSATYPSAASTPVPLSNVVEANQADVSFAYTPVTVAQLQSTPSQAMQKSDLNVPESENIVAPLEQEQKQQQQQQQPATVSNVSNFFTHGNQGSGSGNSDKVNEQKSALNFFQDQPEVSSQPVLNGHQQQANADKLSNESFQVFNFFSMDQASKTELPQQQQQQQQQSMLREEEEFNSPITSSTIQGNDTINDITDKMESLSACSRSTLSLFATSELDSTTAGVAQKRLSSGVVESLIPKYLEQQPPIGESLKGESLVNENSTQKYRSIYCHWFYQNLYWHPFSMSDSLAIDQAILNGDEVVGTSGGRYEVNIRDRRRSSIYWTSGSNAVRKCSWFYVDSMNGKRNIIPYEESLAELFEKEYERALTHEAWNQKINLPDSSEYVVMKDSSTIEHHKMGLNIMVKRGIDEFDIDDGEEGTPDHLILCVSSFGDKIDDNADEIRTKCLETIQQYYTEAFDCGQIKRVEVLPIALNSIDVLKMSEINNIIAGSSSFKMASREINEHIMRTMLYSNENFYQKIMNHLAFSLNEIVSKFKQRNANFNGEISLISSSYEALFLFDLLAHAGASEFWKIAFPVSNFFACGMPVSLLIMRNGDKLKHGFQLAGCRKLFNLIHPNDSIGQRIEPLIIPEYSPLPLELIDNLSCNERIDFTLPLQDASGSREQQQSFTSSAYFTSEAVIKRILNEIYGANCLDSGNL